MPRVESLQNNAKRFPPNTNNVSKVNSKPETDERGLEILQQEVSVVTKAAPVSRSRYSLTELLAASDYSQPQSPEEREWIDAPAVGDELL